MLAHESSVLDCPACFHARVKALAILGLVALGLLLLVIGAAETAVGRGEARGEAAADHGRNAQLHARVTVVIRRIAIERILTEGQ